MINSVINHYKKHKAEVYATIKLVDVEERFDLAFSRFFGLYFAKLGRYFNMTPTQVSIISLLVGVAGAGMLYFQDSLLATIVAAVLISLAGVLDSADGQLARMTSQSTELGRYIDGFIDSSIFLTCYIAGSAYFLNEEMGWTVMLMAIPAVLISHSFSSQIYDFYKCELLYYYTGSESSKVKTVQEVENTPQLTGFWNKFFYKTQLDYTKRQWMLVSRSEEMQATYENYALSESTKEIFPELYRRTFSPLLFWWALIGGTNTHRTMIMAFSIMGRFDLYLVFCLVKLIPMAILILVHREIDIEFHSKLKFKFAT